MNLPDTEMLALLEARDGPLPERSWPHASEAECRYAELYDGQQCPWCEAQRRRMASESQPSTPV